MDEGEQKEKELGSQEDLTRPVDLVTYALHTIEDTLLRFRCGLSWIELQRAKSEDTSLDDYESDAVDRTIEILGFGEDWNPEYVEEWEKLPEEGRENFLDWLAKKSDSFRLRYENFLAEIAPLKPSPTAAQEIQEYLDEENKVRQAAWQKYEEEMRALPRIEIMSEQELREEIVKRINEALGKLAQGPVADGTGAVGFGREWNRMKIYSGERGKMLPLVCSYVRFTKSYERDEQTGVRLELLGIFDSGQVYIATKPGFDKKAARVEQMSPEEKREFEKSRREMDSVKEAIERDGLAPADNRYYFIPLKGDEEPVVSTDSFITRASRANPETADRLIGEEMVANAEREDAKAIDPETGLPHSRIATLQDLRDVVAIVRRYDWFVKQIIEKTPKDLWGRPGLTE